MSSPRLKHVIAIHSDRLIKYDMLQAAQGIRKPCIFSRCCRHKKYPFRPLFLTIKYSNQRRSLLHLPTKRASFNFEPTFKHLYSATPRDLLSSARHSRHRSLNTMAAFDRDVLPDTYVYALADNMPFYAKDSQRKTDQL